MRRGAACAIAKVQGPNFSLNMSSHIPIFTTTTLELLLGKLPPEARKAFQVDNIPHNLVAVATLVNAGCDVHIYDWGFNIDINGETIYKGWRVSNSNLFRMSLTDDGTQRIIPDTDPSEYDSSKGIVMNMNWSVNSVYECENKSQLIRYYHASLASHPKRTLSAAARAGYLKGWPGLTQASINKFISAEDCTELGHECKVLAGK